jgi:hypothetical protein
LLKKYNVNLFFGDSNATIEYANDDKEASNILFERLKPILKSYNGRLFYFKNHIWIEDNNKISGEILIFITESNIYRLVNDKIRPYCQNLNAAKSVQELLFEKIKVNNNDNELYNKFHNTTKYRLCFEDGVLDFKTKTFYKWVDVDFEYYSTIMLNRHYSDYFKNPNRKIINEIKNSIFVNMYGDKTDIALHFLARAIAGNCEDKNFATYVGNRNCGKGVQYEILEYGFCDYIKTFELGNLLYNRTTAGQENVDCSRKCTGYWI